MLVDFKKISSMIKTSKAKGGFEKMLNEKIKFMYCNECGNVITYLDECGGKLVCCNEDMQELVANTSDGAREKHVPVINRFGSSVMVKVGSDAHPMLKEHYIKWIALVTDKCIHIKWLNPMDDPQATFKLTTLETALTAYAYCNLHGLWKTDL